MFTVANTCGKRFLAIPSKRFLFFSKKRIFFLQQTTVGKILVMKMSNFGLQDTTVNPGRTRKSEKSEKQEKQENQHVSTVFFVIFHSCTLVLTLFFRFFFSFEGFLPFSSWPQANSPHVKQYLGNVAMCGHLVDYNWGKTHLPDHFCF